MSLCLQDSKSVTQPDELIDFIHLKSRRGLTQLELEDEVATDLQKATGIVDTAAANSANLNRVLQLTGQLNCQCRAPYEYSCAMHVSVKYQRTHRVESH